MGTQEAPWSLHLHLLLLESSNPILRVEPSGGSRNKPSCGGSQGEEEGGRQGGRREEEASVE